MQRMSVQVRTARVEDVAVILGFIRELAEYERLSDQVSASEADIEAALFSPAPRAFCDIAEVDGEAVGLALWFYNFSTFVGRCGLYLEDLYVRPSARGCGAGKALLRRLARRCVEEKLGRMEWAVLDWNAPAIGFYDSLGASSLEDWRIRRLTGEALAALAGS
jgi:GNAT superfamily N-acetyltransferase